MKCIGSLLVVSALVLVGCGTAPVQTPRAASAFAPPEEEISTPTKQASDAASAFFDNALAKAKSSDAASDFEMRADGLSIFAVTLAAGGALTGSKSKLYKAAGALLGLGMGANQYFKPKDQRAIYFNSAEAAYCSGLNMSSLANQLRDIDARTITKAESAVRTRSAIIKHAVYSDQLSSLGLPPFQTAAIVTAAINSDADSASQLSALNFIKTVHQQAHNRNLVLLRYEISEINKTAFNIDNTLGTIAKLSVAPADTLKALQGLDQALALKNIQGQISTEEAEVSTLLTQLPEMIQTITAFNACTDVLKPVTNGS